MAWSDGREYLDEVARGVYAYIQPDGSWMVNNMGFVVGQGGRPVLIDTSSTERRTKAFLAEVAEHVPGDPLILVNTHHHPDHTYGNCFVPADTLVVAQDRCRVAMQAAGLEATQVITTPDYGNLTVRLPDITFSERMTLWSGPESIELHSVGPAHTTNDTIVWLPQARVLFAGDIAFAGGQPFLLEGSLDGFPRALKAIRDLAPEAVVPGHGPVCRGDEVDRLLTGLEQYVAWIAQVADEGHRAGWTPLETALRHKDNPYRDWQESERLVGNLHRAYSELDGNPIDTVIAVGSVWPQMVQFHGGPIGCRA